MIRKLKDVFKKQNQEDRLEEMSSLEPYETDLPFKIVFLPKSGNEKHWARIKVVINNSYVPLTISDNPEWKGDIPNNISSKDLHKVEEWVVTHKKALLDHWNHKISDFQLFRIVTGQD
ncbi:MAG: hypothetical protein KDK36_07850 [Leptospiraceae bacterium]|nr:hypothetical protein [Leptospiraceae bacterium]